MESTSAAACPFCDLVRQASGAGSLGAVAFPDRYPVAPGHTLVVPGRHVRSVFDLPAGELAALWELVGAVREELRRSHRSDGFNIGINDGAAAGQTIEHAHIHIIARKQGDVSDPRGGVRWVIPERAAYWNVSD